MTPGEALYAMLVGQLAERDYEEDYEPDLEDFGIGFGDATVAILEDQVRDSGSVAQAARDMGIARTTLRRWLKGGKVQKPARVVAGRKMAQRATERRREEAYDLEPPGPIRMVGSLSYGGTPDADRDANLGAYLPWNFKDYALQVIAAGGGPEELQELLIDQCEDDFYRDSIRNGWWDVENFYEGT